MKKLFQLSLICFVLLATACKKEASPLAEAATISITPPQPEVESTGRAANGEWSQPNGAVKLTDDLNEALLSGEPIFVKEVAEHHYIGEAIASPQNANFNTPCNRVMDRFNNYFNANKANFLAWATANCQPYVGAYHDPCGKSIVFMVPPNITNCGQVFIPNQNCWTYLQNGGWQYIDNTYCIMD